MTSGTVLPVGQSLKVPNTISNVHNTANTFKPYNPGEVIGSTAPDMPSPPPPPKPKKKKCGALAMVIIAAVAIVATVMTAGAAAAVMFGAAGGLTAGGALALGSAVMSGAFGMAFAGVAVVSAAIGAAVGSIINQGLAVATGYQDKFSWKQVGQSALAGGISAGVGSIVSGLSTLGSTTNAIISSSASTALTGAARGHFSWKSVVMSATSAAISSRVGEIGVKKWAGTSREFTNNYLGGVARQRIQIAVYGEGKMNYRQVNIDSFGNTIGNSVVSALKYTESEETLKQAAALKAQIAKFKQMWKDMTPTERRDYALRHGIRPDDFKKSMTDVPLGVASGQGAQLANNGVVDEFGDLGDRLSDPDVTTGKPVELAYGSTSLDPVHQSVNRGALGDASPNEFDSATVSADEHQTAADSFVHAMKGGASDESGLMTSGWVRFQMDRAITARIEGNMGEAFFHAGVALHALQDATSPRHRFDDGQLRPWSDFPSAQISSPSDVLKYGWEVLKYVAVVVTHVAGEAISPGLGSNAYRATQDVNEWVKTGTVPMGNLVQRYGVDHPWSNLFQRVVGGNAPEPTPLYYGESTA